MPYINHANALVSLETIPKDAFRPSAGATREECGFFLALALVHNDLKDVVLGQLLLAETPRPDASQPSTHRGQYGGVEAHLLRLLVGLLYELLEVVRSYPAVLSGSLFREVFRQCPKPGKTAWRAIVGAADGKPSNDPLSSALFFVRNKVSYHYDAKELVRGYESAFGQPRFGDPMLSRGNNMQQSRFYFADTAAQAYLLEKTGADAPDAVFGWSSSFSDQVNHALHWLVLKFIEVRGFTFREYRGT